VITIRRQLVLALVAAAIALLAGRTLDGSALPAPLAAGEAGSLQAATDLLYVCVQDDAKIAVVDMGARQVVRTIDLQKLGFPATAKPHYIVVEPDGAH